MIDKLGRESFHAGSVIFEEGEPGAFAYIIESGSVQIALRGEADQTVIATLESGALFGEMTLLDGRPRSASAIATTDTVLIPLTKDQIDDTLHNADPMARMLLGLVLRRFRLTQQWLRDAKTQIGRIIRPTTRDSTEDFGGVGDTTMNMLVKRIALASDLKFAVDTEALEVHYQPIMGFAKDRIAGFEALVRWNRAGTYVPPSEFIPVAECSDIVIELGRQVLRQACEDLKRFQAMANAHGEGPLFMSVNVSARQLRTQGEVEELNEIILRSGVRPERLKLEVTESSLLEDPIDAADAIRRLKSTGAMVALDDFGTGYSSLSYLQRFSIDTLKIDRSFVDQMLVDQGSMKIVRAIMSLARDLGFNVVAEGIESSEQLEFLRQLGCQYAQGYHYAKPMNANKAEAFVRRAARRGEPSSDLCDSCLSMPVLRAS